MSELLARMKADQMVARKARNSEEVLLYSTLIGEIGLITMNDEVRRDTTDADAEQAVRKMSKSIEETKRLTKDPAAVELADRELAILARYKPSQMSEDALKAAIADIRSEKPDAKIGDIMGALKSKFGNTYDGKLASQLAKP